MHGELNFLNWCSESIQIFGMGTKWEIRYSRSCNASSVRLCFKTKDIIGGKLVTSVNFDW